MCFGKGNEEIKKTNIILLSWSLLVFLTILPLWANIKSVLNNCINVLNLGIFQQAAYEIASRHELNPYLTIRSVKIFNDHFDPILLFAAPFTKLLSYNPASLLIWEWSFYVATLLLVFFLQRSRTTSLLYALGMIIFCKGILCALELPGHPDTWAIPFWFLWVYAYKENRPYMLAIFSFLLAGLFKESYAFCFITISFYELLITRRYRWGLFFFLNGGIWLFFTIFLRPKILGPVIDYGSWYAEGLHHPLTFLWEKIKFFHYWGAFKLFAPFMFAFYWFLRFQKWKNPLIVACFFLLLPLYLMHFLMDKILYQYGPALVSVPLAILTLSSFPRFLARFHRLGLLTLLIFFISGMGSYTVFFNMAVLGKSRRCVVDEEKRQYSRQIKNLVNTFAPETRVIATGGIIPYIMRPNLQIYHPGSWITPIDQYDYAILERHGTGYSLPFFSREVEVCRTDCLPYATEVIMDNFYFTVLKGLIPFNCFERCRNMR